MSQPQLDLLDEDEHLAETPDDTDTARSGDLIASLPPDARRGSFARARARLAGAVLLAIALAAALLVIPPPYSTLALLLLAVGANAVLIVKCRVGARRLAALRSRASALWQQTAPLRQPVTRPAGRFVSGAIRPLVFTPPAPLTDDIRRAEKRLRPALLHLELALVIAFALYGAREFTDMDPALQLPGHEAEWLTSSAYFATQSLRHEGRIPLWMPYFESGEPFVTGPFAFVLNPFSFVPSLLAGPVSGIKISVLLATLIAGTGGWALGRVLGLGSLGRVILGLLLIGKGNMHAMIGTGYFQLGVTQAYFPWIIAGMWATLRFQHRRWPVVLAAVAYTLMFFGGNIWYTLPMLLSLIALTLAYAIRPGGGRRVDWVALRRAGMAGALTFGLSAILFLPQWANRDMIGGHKDLRGGGPPVDRMAVVEQFYNGSLDIYLEGDAPGAAQFFYSFTSPLWYLALIFILLPWTLPYRHPALGRLWLVAVGMLVICTAWGVGGHPVFRWLYDHVPLLGQWRFVGRALAVSSFWLAVIIALRVDSLWTALTGGSAAHPRRLPRLAKRAFRSAGVLALAAASLIAAREVIREWHTFTGLDPRADEHDQFIGWLKQNSDRPMPAVYELGYTMTTAYVEHEIRLHDIEADYFPLSLPWTMGQVDLTNPFPPYGISWNDKTTRWLESNGYERFASSASSGYPHLYRYDQALPYAFLVKPSVLRFVKTEQQLFPAATPVHTFRHRMDTLEFEVETPAMPQVLVVGERAYPGWAVQVNGAPARLESVGGLLGVLLEPDAPGETLAVRFAFRPAMYYVGAALTLLAIGVAIASLLEADRHLIRRVRVWRAGDLAGG